MKGGGKNIALAQTDHITIHRRLHNGIRPNFGHERPSNEHQRKILEHDARRNIPSNMPTRRDHNGRSIGSGTKIGDSGERAKLSTICVAPYDGVKRTEIHVLIIVELARQQNHAGTRTEHRLTRGNMRGDRFKQAGRT